MYQDPDYLAYRNLMERIAQEDTLADDELARLAARDEADDLLYQAFTEGCPATGQASLSHATKKRKDS